MRAVAVDHSRISISWEPGPFPNGPVLSYVLQIKDLHPIGYSALKVLPGFMHYYCLHTEHFEFLVRGNFQGLGTSL